MTVRTLVKAYYKNVCIHKKVPQPIASVLILGWGGSSQKNLAKVCNYYESKQCNVVSFIMPLAIPLFIRDILEDELIVTLKDIVVDTDKNSVDTAIDENSSSGSSNISSSRVNKCKKKPLFCHIFSNNGTWVYGNLLKEKSLLSLLPMSSSVTGNPFDKIVIDSAPHLIYNPISIYEEASLYTKVITSTILRKAVYHHPIVSPMSNLALLLVIVTSRVLQSVQDILNMRLIANLMLLNRYIAYDSPLTNMFFIYSQDDKLINPDDIQDFIWKLKVRNSQGEHTIEEKVFPTCSGVSHVGGFYIKNKETIDVIEKFFFNNNKSV